MEYSECGRLMNTSTDEKYLLSAYHKKVYHIARFNTFVQSWRSKCNGIMNQPDGAVVLEIPKGYRPCKKCYRETNQEKNDNDL